MNWQDLFQCFVEAELKPDHTTKPKGSLPRNTARRLTFDEAMKKKLFGAVLQPDTIDISFDDADMSEAFMRMREENDWQCVVLTNPKNGHIHTYWKNTQRRIEKDCYTSTPTACGFTADIHGGFTFIRLREPTHDRFPPTFCPEGDLGEVPDELLPVKTSKTLWGLRDHDGRNPTMSSYIYVLTSQLHLSADKCRHILRNTNNFVFAEPMPDDELETILRDENFEKPIADSNDGADPQEPFRQFLESLGMSIRYNEVANKVEYVNIPQYGDYPNIRDTQNIMPIQLARDYSARMGKWISKAKVTDLILLEADVNTFNPVQDFLQSTIWDKTDRFPRLFEILSVTDKLHQSLIQKWFTQTAAMAFNTLEAPLQAEGVLILQGPEGAGKTRFFQQMAFNPAWFTSLERELNTNCKDTLIQMLSVWIAEIGEIDRTFKANKSDNKSFITKTKDEIRKPYRPEQAEKPRTTSFCGTTNKSVFLTSDSGSRRWWVIPVKHKIVMDDFVKEDNLRQFWAQCYHAYANNPVCFRLTDDEVKLLDKRNRENTEPLPGEEELRTRFDFDAPEEKWFWTTVAGLIDMPPYHVCNFKPAQIGKALAAIGQDVPEIRKRRTKRGSEWHIPPSIGTISRYPEGC